MYSLGGMTAHVADWMNNVDLFRLTLVLQVVGKSVRSNTLTHSAKDLSPVMLRE
jgi:hypothetical protein